MMRLRAAKQTDSAQTGAILGEFTTGTSWLPQLHSGAENEAFCSQMIANGWVMVAEEHDVITGFIARNETYIHALYVAEANRGKGIGSQLLELAKADEFSLSLWTYQANRNAQRFYLHHGFTEAERTDGCDNDVGLPDVRFIWQRGN